MPIEHNIWRVGAAPEPLGRGSLQSEQLLEDMIVAAPEILSPEWMKVAFPNYDQGTPATAAESR